MKNKKISSKMKELWKDPIWREKTLASRRGLKRSVETKEKMRLSAIERNKNPEYIQKLKDNHWSTKNSQKDRCAEISRQNMLKNNPMKDPKIVKKVSLKNKKGWNLLKQSTKNLYLHNIAWNLRGKKHCEHCGISNEEHRLKYNGYRLEMHNTLQPKDYHDLSKKSWLCLCKACHIILEYKILSNKE